MKGARDLRHSAKVVMIRAFGRARPPYISSGLTPRTAYRSPVLDFNRTQPPAMLGHGTGKICHRGQDLLGDLVTQTAHGSALRSSNVSLRSLLADAFKGKARWLEFALAYAPQLLPDEWLTASRATKPRHDEDELLDTVCARMRSSLTYIPWARRRLR